MTPAVYTLDQIKPVIDKTAVLEAIAEGFAMYSAGKVTVPPVGHLYFEQPPGDCHIKYGYIQGAETYVIKIASGFYDNPKLGLSSSNGMMLVFSQKTGQAQAVLLDEGYLTDIRTAAAGAVAARHLAPRNIKHIGIVGTGIQARLQLEWLAEVTDCRTAMVWGRGEKQLAAYIEDMHPLGFEITPTQDTHELARACNLIVTCTPSTSPLLQVSDLLPGTHITAVGADGGGKHELDPRILAKADVVVADSLSQCREYGEIHYAIVAGHLRERDGCELGAVIGKTAQGRTRDDQITVADLTGVAVQDIQVATLVWRGLISTTGATHP